MKKIVLIFLIFALFSCIEKKPVQKKETDKEINKSTPRPQVEFDTEMHDFGQIKSGEILSFTFVFTNQGKSDFLIYNAETDCGCLEVKVPQKTISPGEKGLIEVLFNSAGMVGKQLKTIELQSNSKETKHLIIFAEVENEQIEIKY
jgi:hypothetical protein